METEIIEETRKYIDSEIKVLEDLAMINYNVAKKFLEQLPERIRYFVEEHHPPEKGLYLDLVGFELTQRAGLYGEDSEGSFFEELSDKLRDINKEIRHWLD